jgi:uncharacterized membrane protein
MSSLFATIAVYDSDADAEADWVELEAAAEAATIETADAAFIANRAGEAVVLQRQSKHGWGKGAVAGAVVGILFPPALLGATALGAGGGALVAGMSRSLGRGKVQDLGEALDSGSLAIIVVAPAESSDGVTGVFKHAKTVKTAPSATKEEIQQLMSVS